jgi:protein O-GlcNAc transferase
VLLAPRLAMGVLLLPSAAVGGAAPGHVAVSRPRHREALAHYRAGLESMREESWENAEREFRTAVRLDPSLVMAHYSLGEARMSLHRYPEAVRAFLDCQEAYHEVAARQELSQTLADQRRLDEIQEVKDAIGRSSRKPEDSRQALRLESRLQRLEAERLRETTSMETPAEFSLALGSAYFRSGRPADAEREYRAAVRADPGLGEAHNNLAVLCFLTGRLDEAETEVTSAERSGYVVSPRFKTDLKEAEERKEGR